MREAARERSEKARLLMTQPGVGPITALAFVLTIGDVNRFPRSKQLVSYVGLIPREYSSGGHQRFGSISKQGNRFMRMLLVEAAQIAVRYDPGIRNEYLHRCHRNRRAWPRWQRRGNWPFDSTGCCERKRRIQRSSRREQLAGAPGQRKLDRRLDWALSSRCGSGFG